MRIELLFFMNIILATNNPLKLYAHTLENIRNNIDNVTLKVIERMYPNFFDRNCSPSSTGLFDLFYHNLPASKEIDLSKMNLERIPISLASKMIDVKSINLSKNYFIEIEEEWFQYFYDNLEELNLSYSNLTEDNLKVIQKCKSLKKLSIAGHENLHINSLLPIIGKLNYLDLSNRQLNDNDFRKILQTGINLEYLNFSKNDLSNLSHQITSDIKTLNVSNCHLKSLEQFRILINLTNLEEIDFSFNDFSEIDTSATNQKFLNSIENHFLKSLNSEQSTDYFRNCNNLKRLNLSCCKIKDYQLIKNLFNIKGLEKLDLSGNQLNFDFQEIVEGKAKDTLKELNLKLCNINDIKNFYFLTDFAHIEKLTLSDNSFDMIYTEFSLGKSKYSLKELNMVNCQLDHNGIKSITDFSCLEKLDISFNNLSEIPRNFTFGCSKKTLKELSAFRCGLNHLGLETFSDCPKLEKLNIAFNEFHDIPDSFSFKNLKYSLKELDISRCHLNYNGLRALYDCENIQILNLSYNHLNFLNEFNIGFKNHLKNLEIRDCELNIENFKIFTDCPNLTKLDGYYNNLNSFENHYFRLGCSKNSLREIELSSCSMDIQGLKELTDCPNLIRLEVSYNNFGNIPEDFNFGRSKETLNYLEIKNSNLNHEGLRAIAECKKLKTLIIPGNNFKFVSSIFNFKNLETELEVLNMNNCDITYVCLNAISKCRRLSLLDIANNENLGYDYKTMEFISYFSERIFNFNY